MNKKGQIQAYEILVIVLLVGVVGWIVWYSITKSTESQKAKIINNYNYDQHSFLGIGGCMRLPNSAEIKPNVDTKTISPVTK